MSWPNRIRLDTPQACQVELERCSNGLAELDYLFTQTREAILEAEHTVSEWTVQALRDIERPKGITARELDSRIAGWFAENEEAAEAKARLNELENTLAQIERYYRSLEKRGMFASAAYKGHGEVERLGGRTG